MTCDGVSLYSFILDEKSAEVQSDPVAIRSSPQTPARVLELGRPTAEASEESATDIGETKREWRLSSVPLVSSWRRFFSEKRSIQR